METKLISNEQDLKKAFMIREQVFVNEQGVAIEDEFDEFDVIGSPCRHILVFYDEQAVGTGRIRFLEQTGKLERICILEPYRKLGIGKIIIGSLEGIAESQGAAQVKLHGQTQAEGFYKKLGYESRTAVFMEDGIPHIVMTKDLSQGKRA